MKRYRLTQPDGTAYGLDEIGLRNLIEHPSRWTDKMVNDQIQSMGVGDILVSDDEKLERLADAGTALWPFALTVAGGVLAGVILDRLFRRRQ